MAELQVRMGACLWGLQPLVVVARAFKLDYNARAIICALLPILLCTHHIHDCHARTHCLCALFLRCFCIHVIHYHVRQQRRTKFDCQLEVVTLKRPIQLLLSKAAEARGQLVAPPPPPEPDLRGRA